MSIAKNLRILFLAPAFSFFAPALAPAQQPTSPPAPEIHLNVVVTPKNGQPVANLTQSDFTLLDNKSPQPITHFRAAAKDTPVEAILLIDAVNTGIISVSYERDQITRFLTANGGKLALPTSLAILTDSGIQAQAGRTLDGNALAKSLASQVTGLRTIGRSTGFYGAEERLGLSLNALRALTNDAAKRPGRKLLLWISPGWPILSGPNIDLSAKQQRGIFASVVDISTQLRQANITLYAVDPLGTNESMLRRTYYQEFTKGVTKPGQTQPGNLSLQVLSVQSGGLVLNSSNDIAALLQQCVNDASAYYELSFTPSPGEHPDEYHQIEVKTTQPGLTARTREGYYAQPTPTFNHVSEPDLPARK